MLISDSFHLERNNDVDLGKSAPRPGYVVKQCHRMMMYKPLIGTDIIDLYCVECAVQELNLEKGRIIIVQIPSISW